GITSKEPLLPARPSSEGLDPLFQVHVPGSVATSRTRKVWSPSQNPYTRLLKFGPGTSTQIVTCVYALVKDCVEVKLSSCFSQTRAAVALEVERVVAIANRGSQTL